MQSCTEAQLEGPAFVGCGNYASATLRNVNPTTAYRSRGRLGESRLTAYLMAETTEGSMLCAAQIEDIDSSYVAGSRMSAGSRVFKSSAVLSCLEVEDDCAGSASEYTDRDPLRDTGVENLTVCLA